MARSKANKKLIFDLCMLVGVSDVLMKKEKVPEEKRGDLYEYNFTRFYYYNDTRV